MEKDLAEQPSLFFCTAAGVLSANNGKKMQDNVTNCFLIVNLQLSGLPLTKITINNGFVGSAAEKKTKLEPQAACTVCEKYKKTIC